MNTPQETMWRSSFGDQYTQRSPGDVEANKAFFSRIFHWPQQFGFQSIVELGAGEGNNLRALHALYPQAELAAVEINAYAAGRLPDCVELHIGSILEWEPERTWDLAFTKGVMIHINPEHLPMAYEALYRASQRWVLIAEYYNPTPVEVEYRGHKDLLFKRDFAGEMLDRYDDLILRDYGFVYHGDRHPQDDLTWFLLEKSLANPDLGLR